MEGRRKRGSRMTRTGKIGYDDLREIPHVL
jgi:hypothetical protein